MVSYFYYAGDAKDFRFNSTFTNTAKKIKALVILGVDHFDVLRAVVESGLDSQAVIVEQNPCIEDYMFDAVKMAEEFASEGDVTAFTRMCLYQISLILINGRVNYLPKLCVP